MYLWIIRDFIEYLHSFQVSVRYSRTMQSRQLSRYVHAAPLHGILAASHTYIINLCDNKKIDDIFVISEIKKLTYRKTWSWRCKMWQKILKTRNVVQFLGAYAQQWTSLGSNDDEWFNANTIKINMYGKWSGNFIMYMTG